MVSGMIEGAIKQMIDKFPGVSPDKLISTMKGQPQANQLFEMMKRVGLTDDIFKGMIDAEISRRRKL